MPNGVQELEQVQEAVRVMMAENGLSLLHQPVTQPINDMGAFPDLSQCGIDKLVDITDQAYTKGDKDGYLLFGHDKIPDGSSYELFNYLPQRYTQGTYTVDAQGNVTQVSYP